MRSIAAALVVSWLVGGSASSVVAQALPIAPMPPFGDLEAETWFLTAPCSRGHVASTPTDAAERSVMSTADRDAIVGARPSTPSGAAPASGPPCDVAAWAALDSAALAMTVATADLGCLGDLWSFDANVATVLSAGNVVAVAEAAEIEALDLVANADRLQRYLYFFQIAFFHEFYEATLTYDAATVTAAQGATVVIGDQSALVAVDPPLELLDQWGITIDSTNASHLAVDTIEAVLVRYLADPAHEADFQERVIAYRCLFTLARQIGNQNLALGSGSPWFSAITPGLFDAVAAIALDLTYDDDTVYLVDNALWVLSRFGFLDTPTRDAAHASITAGYFAHVQYSSPWLRIVQDLDNQFDGELSTGEVLDFDSIRASVRALALPNTYTFDQGRMVFETAIDAVLADQMYDAIQEVEAQFFRKGARLQPVPGDENEVIRLVIYGSPSDYQTYQPFLYGLGTNNGGIFIESWGTLFTYDRTPQQSIYTLEELLRHEYTHYLDSRYLVVGSFGESGTLYEGDRLVWYNEGLAEYMVGARRLGGVYPRSTLFEQIGNDVTRLSIADVVSASYSQGFTFYRYAGALFEFLEEVHPELLRELFDVIRGDDLAVVDAFYQSLATDPTLQTEFDAFLDAGIAAIGVSTFAEDIPTSVPPVVTADNATSVTAELESNLPAGSGYLWANRYRYEYSFSEALGSRTLDEFRQDTDSDLDASLDTLATVSSQHDATVAWFGELVVEAGTVSGTVVFEGTYLATSADTQPPGVPGNVTVVDTSGAVALSWTSPANDDLGGYFVYRATTSGGPYELVNALPLWETSYDDPIVAAGPVYYAVTAIDASGNESGLSAEVSAEAEFDVLLVNGHFDTASSGDFQAYRNQLEALGIAHATWDPFVDGPVTSELLAGYEDGVVVWAIGYFHTGYPEQLGPVRRALLTDYLDAGGRLMMSGAFVAAYLDDTPLFDQYLFVDHDQWSMETPGLLGVVGNPVGDGLDMILPSTVYASELTASPPGEVALAYDPASGPGVLTGGSAAVVTVDQSHRSVFLSFPFSALTNSDRLTLIDRAMAWLIPVAPCASPFIRGDANGSGSIDVADAIAILDFLFAAGAVPQPIDAADLSDDGEVDIADAVYLLSYLFNSGPAPAAPFPLAGCE